jgi:hypothetical protein
MGKPPVLAVFMRVAVSRFAREPAGYEPTEVLLLHTAINSIEAGIL